MIKCLSVIIKFLDKNVPMQEVRALQTTGAKYLYVTRDNSFVTINFGTVTGQVLKQINFNTTDVKEYACEYVETKPESGSDPKSSEGVYTLYGTKTIYT